ncbi:hypothetical protein [Streptomyces sp. R08]|uniref:Secreted protein n=1 Tax=Streptomyces sp. R08 TaxID=3238624 RepID=A0AB39MBK8_9ACTN
MWTIAVGSSVFVLIILAAAGTWVYGAYSMSDPTTVILAGIRIDDSRISVKMPTCQTDTVGTVEVYNSDSAKLLWQASGPKTSAGKRGSVTLWKAADFHKASPTTQPTTLPANLDVSVTFAGVEDGTGDVFNVPRVKAARIPDGQYWTRDGARSATQIDAQLKCNSDA